MTPSGSAECSETVERAEVAEACEYLKKSENSAVGPSDMRDRNGANAAPASHPCATHTRYNTKPNLERTTVPGKQRTRPPGGGSRARCMTLCRPGRSGEAPIQCLEEQVDSPALLVDRGDGRDGSRPHCRSPPRGCSARTRRRGGRAPPHRPRRQAGGPPVPAPERGRRPAAGRTRGRASLPPGGLAPPVGCPARSPRVPGGGLRRGRGGCRTAPGFALSVDQ